MLVVIYTPDLQVLLLERADHPGYWQSVTGSQLQGETLLQTASRETAEETGLDTANFLLTDLNLLNKYKIFQEWRWRYAPGVTHNTEHAFSLLLPELYFSYSVTKRASTIYHGFLNKKPSKRFSHVAMPKQYVNYFPQEKNLRK